MTADQSILPLFLATFLVCSSQLLQAQAQTIESPMPDQMPPKVQITTPVERDSKIAQGEFDWGLLGLIGLLGLAGLTGRREIITTRRSPDV
jgi:hypothetical protein